MTGAGRPRLRTVLGAADVVAAALAWAGAYILRFGSGVLPVEGRTDILPTRYLAALPAVVLLLVLATAWAGLYDERRAVRPAAAADIVRLAALSLASLATVTLLYWTEFQYSRVAVLLAASLYAALCPLLRRAALAAVRRRAASATNSPGALVIGGGRPAAALERALGAGPWPAVRVTGVLPIGEDAAFRGATRLRTAQALDLALASGAFREVYVAVDVAHGAEVPALLARLEQVPVDVRYVPDLGDTPLVNPGVTFPGGLPVVALRERPLGGLRSALKRAMDVVLASVLLLALAPVLVLIALGVRLSSRGPALYVQERMGLDGRPFRMVKFRTMRIDAEAAGGPRFAQRGDPRTTAVGRFLRRFSLDELPQLWNVLRGEMSLVGPRPERGAFIEEFRRRVPGYMLRHAVKAGMTGWAQVHGLRGDTSIDDRLRYDLEYVDRWSLSLDVEILGRTALHVISGRNAY